MQEERCGRAITLKEIRAFAQLVMHAGSSTTPVGKNWARKLVNRNPRLQTMGSRLLASDRAYYTSQKAMNEHFNRLFTVTEELKILPKNIANLDENGVAEGESKAGKVVGSNLTKYSMKITSGARTWVSTLECIKAEGARLIHWSSSRVNPLKLNTSRLMATSLITGNTLIPSASGLKPRSPWNGSKRSTCPPPSRMTLESCDCSYLMVTTLTQALTSCSNVARTKSALFIYLHTRVKRHSPWIWLCSQH